MSDALHVVCGQCDSVVRIPRDRIDHAPRCPKCHAGLLTGGPIELHAANFDKHASRNDLPLVVDVWAPWCGPCQMMAPHFEEAARRFGTRARFAKVNSDQEPALSQRFAIRSIPTLLVLKDGNLVARQAGAMDLRSLSTWLTNTLI